MKIKAEKVVMAVVEFLLMVAAGYLIGDVSAFIGVFIMIWVHNMDKH